MRKTNDKYAGPRYKDQENCFVHRLKLKESINNNLKRKQQRKKKKRKKKTTNHQRQQRKNETMSSENDVNLNLCASYCFSFNAKR